MTEVRNLFDILFENSTRLKNIFYQSWTQKPKPEFCSGVDQQIISLSLLREKYSNTSVFLLASSGEFFEDIQNVYSLYPPNLFILQFVRDIILISFPEQVENIRLAYSDSPVMLHISCHGRLHSAHDSIHSFSCVNSTIKHLIVLGDKNLQNNNPCLSFLFSGNILYLPVPDTYEALHLKCFHCYFLFYMLLSSSSLVKVDDDARMNTKRGYLRLERCLSSHRYDYSGYCIKTSLPQHCIGNGWHIGKTIYPHLNKLGCQSPFPPEYADGGMSYMLSPSSIKLLSLFYFSHPSFFQMRSWLPEDALVGLALHQAGVKIKSINPSRYGIKTEVSSTLCHDSKSYRDFLDNYTLLTSEAFYGLF